MKIFKFVFGLEEVSSHFCCFNCVAAKWSLYNYVGDSFGETLSSLDVKLLSSFTSLVSSSLPLLNFWQWLLRGIEANLNTMQSIISSPDPFRLLRFLHFSLEIGKEIERKSERVNKWVRKRVSECDGVRASRRERKRDGPRVWCRWETVCAYVCVCVCVCVCVWIESVIEDSERKGENRERESVDVRVR